MCPQCSAYERMQLNFRTWPVMHNAMLGSNAQYDARTPAQLHADLRQIAACVAANPDVSTLSRRKTRRTMT